MYLHCSLSPRGLTFSSLPPKSLPLSLCGAMTATTELFLPLTDQADDSSMASSSSSSSFCIYLCCSVLHLPPLSFSPLTPPFSFFASLCFSPSSALFFTLSVLSVDSSSFCALTLHLLVYACVCVFMSRPESHRA